MTNAASDTLGEMKIAVLMTDSFEQVEFTGRRDEWR